jgi:hypothetical protein
MKLVKRADGSTRAQINESGTRKTVQDSSGKTQGWYDANTDKTFDRTGRVVGQGDQTGALYPE